MAGIIGIVRRFLAFREAGQAVQIPQCVEIVHPPGQHFIGIDLVPDVENDLILRQVKCRDQSKRQFHHAQIRCKMAALLCCFFH